MAESDFKQILYENARSGDHSGAQIDPPKVINFVAAVSAMILLFVSAFATAGPPMMCDNVSFPGDTQACRSYTGADWTIEAATQDCGQIPGATGGELVVGPLCDATGIVGTCQVDAGTGNESTLYFYTGDAAALENSCINFLGGAWSATALVGSCNYLGTNGPPGTPENEPQCVEYSGTGWDESAADAECSSRSTGLFNLSAGCAQDDALGFCTFNAGSEDENRIFYYTGDPGTLQAGCESPFAGGVWTGIEQQAELMPEALAALVSDDLVTVTPEGVSDEALEALIDSGQAIEFAPVGVAPEKGLLIYPGGGVDPRAYAVAARLIAEQGFLVAIVPFPGRLAITDPFRANAILMAHPEISDWAIAGHSLGGVTAAIYSAANPFGKIKAIAFWAAYVPDSVDLNGSGLKGLSLLATLDGTLDRDEWDAALPRLPESTYVIDIQGGNHAQFGYYGDQEGDNQAKISHEYQHQLFTGATVHLLNRIGVAEADDAINSLYANLSPDYLKIGQFAQKQIVALKRKDLRKGQINNTLYLDQDDFQLSKPSFPTDGPAKVDVTTYPHQVANPSDITAPPIYDGELWIKMKSQEAFVEHYAVTPKKEQRGCDRVQSWLFHEALFRVDRATLFEYLTARVWVRFKEDNQAASGPEWLGQGIEISQQAGNFGYTQYALKASRLQVPTVVPSPFGGVFYCKVWSPMAFTKFIVDQTK